MRTVLAFVLLLSLAAPSLAFSQFFERFFRRAGTPEVLPAPTTLLDSINQLRAPQAPISIDSAHSPAALQHAIDQAQDCIKSGGFPYWLDGDSYLLVTNVVDAEVVKSGETGRAVVIPDLSALRKSSVYWPNFNSTMITRTSLAFARNEACDKVAGKTTLFFSFVVGPCPGPSRSGDAKTSDLCL